MSKKKEKEKYVFSMNGHGRISSPSKKENVKKN